MRCAGFRFLAAWLLSLQIGVTQQAGYDFVLRNARIVDGTGSGWFLGDIAVAGDRIAAMGVVPKRPAAVVIDEKISGQPGDA